MAVTQANHPLVVGLLPAKELDGQDPEIPGPFVAERMTLLGNVEPGRLKLGFHLVEDVAVR